MAKIFERTSMRRITLAIALVICAMSGALAQSNPNLTYGQVPTAAQWNSYFAIKQDVLGFVPLNAAGGSMAGSLFLLPSSAGGAGFNIGVGVAPSFPNNGDMWETATGLFARINGSSVNISTGGSPAISFPATVSGTANSGGIPYFSSSTNMASTAVLGAGLLVKGGGAGVAPSTFTLGGGCTFATPNITCAANSLTGTTLASSVVASSLTSVAALTGGSTAAGFTLNLATSTVSGALPQANSPSLTGDATKPAGSSTTSIVLTGDVTKSAGSNVTTLVNKTITINGTACTLGLTCTFSSSAANTSTSASPTGTSSTSGVMMGLAKAITPTNTGNVMMILNGSGANNTINDSCQVAVRYGTGTAPTNGAALTGTAPGLPILWTNISAGFSYPWSAAIVATGLTIGTPYWVDASLTAVSGGTCSIASITVSLMEQ